MSSSTTIRKHDDSPGSTALEAQGLTWLAEAMAYGGALVVPVVAGHGWIDEPRLPQTSPTPQAAEDFGRALAVTHAAGAPAFGVAPPGWDGTARMGRSDIRIRRHAPEPADTEPRAWGTFYAEDRLACYLEPCLRAGSLTSREAAVLERVCERLADGEWDAGQPALVERAAAERGDRVAVARTHGDLWSGNVLWVPGSAVEPWAPPRAGTGPARPAGQGADDAGAAAAADDGSRRGERARGRGDVVGVLIDPLAQGAAAETDLAALGVFGQPFLERIYAAYDEVSPLPDGWRERVGLHQLHMLMIHTFLFGGGYGAETAALARRYA